LSYTAAADASNSTSDNYDGMRIAWDKDGSLAEESSAKTLESTGVQDNGRVYWAGVMSTYFLSAVLPGSPDGGMTVKARLQQNVYRAALEEPEISLAPGEDKICSVSYWFGPKERTRLQSVSPELAKSIDLGMFSLIAKGLLWLLQIFYSWVHNWGIAIIFLTVLIKAAFWPLTAKSYSSMEKMKKLQPMMTNLREKYKDDKERMNKEVMALYKTYGVNPASGCVPILIQLPVFFGLYQALLTAIELRHAPFIVHLPFTDIIWLADLSSKDPYYITPVVMGLTMFLQQRMSPPAADPTQQKVMMFLPLIFTVLFLSFPSGLVIYWLVNNILSIAQQWLMIRKNSAARV
jgi:YidC/Oxa1 family membrane protein insertase